MLKTSIIIFLYVVNIVYVCNVTLCITENQIQRFKNQDKGVGLSFRETEISPHSVSWCDNGPNSRLQLITFNFFQNVTPEKENGQGKDYPYTPKKDGQFYYRSVQSQRKLSINAQYGSSITLAITGNSRRPNANDEPLYFRGSMFDPGG